MEMRTRILTGALAVALGGVAIQANAQPFFQFSQKGGFLDGTQVTFPPPAGLIFNVSDPTDVPPPADGSWPADTYHMVDWEFTGDPGDPSSLRLDTYDSGITVDTPDSPYRLRTNGDVDGDGEWNSSDWWSIARFTQTNNVINGSDVPLWEMDTAANTRIFNAAGMLVFADLDSIANIQFNETLNSGACNQGPANPFGTTCDDFYRTALTDFDPLTFDYDGMEFLLTFRVVSEIECNNEGSSCLIEDGGDLLVYTAENSPGISTMDIQMHWEKVPAPATIALLGLGLAGLRLNQRRRKES